MSITGKSIPFISKKDIIYFTVLVIIASASILPLYVYRANPRLTQKILLEGGIYESAAALACLLASVIFLYTFLKFPVSNNLFFFKTKRNIFLLILSFVMFIIFMEEISWGQHLLGFETPALIRRFNYQGELNIHNLKMIQDSNNYLVSHSTKLMVFYLFGLPFLTASFDVVRNLFDRIKFPCASIRLALITYMVIFINRYSYVFVYGGWEPNDVYHIGEIFEGNMEYLLLLLSLELYYYSRQATASDKHLAK